MWWRVHSNVNQYCGATKFKSSPLSKGKWKWHFSILSKLEDCKCLCNSMQELFQGLLLQSVVLWTGSEMLFCSVMLLPMEILNTRWREMRSKGEKLQDGWQRRIRDAVRRGIELRRGANEADRCKKPVQKAGHTEERLSEQSNERAPMQDAAQWGEQWLDNVRAVHLHLCLDMH